MKTNNTLSYITGQKNGPIYTANDITTGDTQLAICFWTRRVHQTDSAITPTLQLQLGMKTDRYNIIRCHGKLGTAYSNNGKEPLAYLPHQSNYTNLVVLEYHVRLCHSGPVHTLTAVRISFWIPKGKPTTRVIIDDLQNGHTGGREGAR